MCCVHCSTLPTHSRVVQQRSLVRRAVVRRTAADQLCDRLDVHRATTVRADACRAPARSAWRVEPMRASRAPSAQHAHQTALPRAPCAPKVRSVASESTIESVIVVRLRLNSNAPTHVDLFERRQCAGRVADGAGIVVRCERLCCTYNALLKRRQCVRFDVESAPRRTALGRSLKRGELNKN